MLYTITNCLCMQNSFVVYVIQRNVGSISEREEESISEVHEPKNEKVVEDNSMKQDMCIGATVEIMSDLSVLNRICVVARLWNRREGKVCERTT